MKLIDWIDLPNLGDERGGLVVAEASKNIPFKINRIYYIFDVKPKAVKSSPKRKLVDFSP